MFIKVIVRNEIQERADNLSQMWLANNLQQKALKEILQQYKDMVNPPTKEDLQQRIMNNWAKIASLKQV